MKVLLIFLISLICVYIALRALAAVRSEYKNIDDSNPYVHPEVAYDVLPDDMAEYVDNMPNPPNRQSGLYERFFKRFLDSVVSFLGLIILSPLFLVMVTAIKIDDPGPALFTQNRVGKDNEFFSLHKFRSMKMSTPHDIPTHMLKNPEQYITRIGRFLRKTSLDELPQIWDIFRGKMSIIGPRPALWNQADLVSEREKYGVNALTPGLTGLAQINGRDELEIPQKVSFDKRYAENISFAFDIKCFFLTIVSVVKHEGIVEGGTGELTKQNEKVKK